MEMTEQRDCVKSTVSIPRKSRIGVLRVQDKTTKARHRVVSTYLRTTDSVHFTVYCVLLAGCYLYIRCAGSTLSGVHKLTTEGSIMHDFEYYDSISVTYEVIE